MKAIVLKDVEKLELVADHAEPRPEPGEAVVRIKHAALNHRDLWIKKGLYAGLKFPVIPGSDGFGVLESDAAGLKAGTEVIINPSLDWGNNPRAHGKNFTILGLPKDGTFAERIAIAESNIVPKPTHLTPEQAAALPLAGLTAYRALFTRGQLKEGQNVLITGIGGGAAMIAMLFAVATGANVFVTSSSYEKLEKAKELGAKGGSNYGCSNWAERLMQEAGPFDLVVDSAGGPDFLHIIDVTAPGGRIVFFGATRDNPPELSMRKVFWKQLSILGTTMGNATEFAEMSRFVEEKKIVPVVGDVYPLAEAEAAYNLMDRGDQFGKIVLAV